MSVRVSAIIYYYNCSLQSCTIENLLYLLLCIEGLFCCASLARSASQAWMIKDEESLIKHTPRAYIPSVIIYAECALLVCLTTSCDCFLPRAYKFENWPLINLRPAGAQSPSNSFTQWEHAHLTQTTLYTCISFLRTAGGRWKQIQHTKGIFVGLSATNRRSSHYVLFSRDALMQWWFNYIVDGQQGWGKRSEFKAKKMAN